MGYVASGLARMRGGVDSTFLVKRGRSSRVRERNLTGGNGRSLMVTGSRRAGTATIPVSQISRGQVSSAGNSVRVSIERPAHNRRIINADVLISAPVEVVWALLSDYERLDEYIPNLAFSVRKPHPRKGGIRLEQCGVQSILGFEFKASVTMDMTQVQQNSADWRAIEFALVESRDFREFQGSWTMARVDDFRTALFYNVSIVPKGLVPVRAIEWRISEDVPQNLQAVKTECEARRRNAVAQARKGRMLRNEN